MTEKFEDKVDTSARWVSESKKLVVFTGAGISTESGLPDYRDPDGVWTRKAKGLSPRSIDWSSVEPNPGSIEGYLSAMKTYTDFTGMNPKELIDEAEDM